MQKDKKPSKLHSFYVKMVNAANSVQDDYLGDY